MSLLQIAFCQGAGFEGAEKWIHLQDRTPIHKKQAPTCLHPRLEALTMKELPFWDSQYSNESEEGLRHDQRSSSRRHTPQSSQTPTPTTKKRRTANQ